MVDDPNQIDSELGNEKATTQQTLGELLDASAAPAWWHVDSRRYGVVIGGLSVLLPSGVDSEVLDTAKLTRLPRSPAELLGITNVRGTLVPVFDLARMHDWAPVHSTAATSKRVIVMVGSGIEAYGLSVSGLPQALRDLVVDISMVAPPAIGRHFVSAWRTPEGVIWLELNIANLLVERAASLSETKDVSMHSPIMTKEEEFT